MRIRHVSWTVSAGLAAALVLMLGTLVSLSAPSMGKPSAEILQGPGHQAYQIALNGDSVVPPVSTEARAQAWFVYSGTLSDMYFRVQTTHIVNARKVTLYEGDAGTNGAPVVTLWEYGVSPEQFDDDHPLQGHVDLSSVEVGLLSSGSLYAVVTTSAHVDGEIRGQIASYALPTGFVGQLGGQFEVPPVDTVARGQFTSTLNEGATELSFTLSIVDLVEPMAAHIHSGISGTNGPPELWLYDATGFYGPDDPFDSTHPLSGTLSLSTDQLADLLAGMAYVNVHTMAHSSGEIRSQLAVYNDQPPTPTPTLTPLPSPTGSATADPSETADATATTSPTSDGSPTSELTPTADGSETATPATPTADGSETATPETPTPTGSETPSETETPSQSETPAVTGTPSETPDGTPSLTATHVPTGLATSTAAPSNTPAVDRLVLQAALSGGEEVPPVSGAGAARALLVVERSTGQMYYRLDVASLPGISAAHVHTGLPGVNGPPVVWLYDAAGVNAPGGPLDETHPLIGSVAIAPTVADALANGAAYVNIHTAAHGSGAARGQVEAYDSSNAFSLSLGGDSEVPPVVTSASGDAIVTFGPDFRRLHAHIAVADILGITQAHVHRGAPGVAGPPVAWLYDATGVEAPGGPFDPDYPLDIEIALSAEGVRDILGGGSYLNVHTVDHPSGEIRGQIGEVVVPAPPPASQIAATLHAVLSGDLEVPPVASGASANASFVAAETPGGSVIAQSGDYRLSIRIDVAGLDDITAAHLHRGSTAESGPVVLWIYDATGAEAPSGVFDSDHPLRRTVSLSPELYAELIHGDLYINIHSADHSSGEIRGQVEAFTPRHDTIVALNGASEAPPVNSEASGQMAVELELGSGSGAISYGLAAYGLQAPTAAHLQRGRPGENGPVFAWLYDPSGGAGPSGDLSSGATITGTVQLTEAELTDVLAGAVYANVRTATYPTGEIRGDLDVAPGADTVYKLALPQIIDGAYGAVVSVLSALPDALRPDQLDRGAADRAPGVRQGDTARPDAIGPIGQTGIQIQNLSPLSMATYIADFFSPNGDLSFSTSADVSPGAASNIWLPGTSVLDGVYAAQVRSNQPAGAIVRTDWPATGGAAIYSDVVPSRSVALPLAVRHYLGQSSLIAVQNFESRPVSVDVSLHEMGEPTAAMARTLVLPGNGSTVLDLDAQAPELGERFIGAMLAEATGAIAVQSFVNIATSDRAVYGFEGVAVTSAATRLYAPLFRAKQYPRAGDPGSGRLDTGIAVVNPGERVATVTITYRGSRDRAASVACRGQIFNGPTVDIEPGSSHVFYQGDPAAQGLPDDCFGSASLVSTAPVLAIVNDSLNEGATAAAYNAVATGARRIALPLYRREHVGLSTGIQAMNLADDPAQVTISFVRQNPDGTTTPVEGCGEWCTVSIEPGEAHTWWPPNQPALAPGSFGAAVIESTQPLAVIVNDAEVVGARDMATYNGLNVAP